MSHLAPEYVAARRVLLDALDALTDHLDQLVLVGAQAVYLHTDESDLNVPLMTTDADLAVNAAGLEDAPQIGTLLQAAGFAAGANPGHWLTDGDLAVDLMVVPHQSWRSRPSARAAHLGVHGKQAARIAPGLEPALIDHATAQIKALDAHDSRVRSVRVAGPAALLTAKAIKIQERVLQSVGQPDRIKAKDALDIFRILQAVETEDLVEGFLVHQQDEHAASATAQAIAYFRAEGPSPGGQLASLARQEAGGDRIVGYSFAALAADLLNTLPRDIG